MTIETTVFTFQISNTFEEWAKIFDSPEIDEFHKTVGLSPLYRGKGVMYLKVSYCYSSSFNIIYCLRIRK